MCFLPAQDGGDNDDEIVTILFLDDRLSLINSW